MNQVPSTTSVKSGARKARPSFSAQHLLSGLRAWAGLSPFLLFVVAFMVLPAALLLAGSLSDADGRFTLENLAKLGRPDILKSYWLTIQVSGVSAIGGTVIGFVLAWAISRGALPPAIRFFFSTFSGVASNFAGVPLAFAFIATLGRVGLLTGLLSSVLGINLYDMGFSLYGFWGLSLTYLYFQVPLMVLIIQPVLEGIKPEWAEAAATLGGGRWRYRLQVALPVLAPSLLASLILLFGNAFGAYATAYALTGGLLNLVPILIGAQIRGDVLHDPALGYALAMGMVLVMLVCVGLHGLLQKQASRWQS